MKRILKTLCAAIILVAPATAVFGYDQDLAASYDRFFQPFAGSAAAKNLQQMPVPDYVNAIKKGERLVTLDVRTPGEAGFFAMSAPGSLTIPMDQVFKPENLARLPTDQKIVVVCKAGHRAYAVAYALRHIGFENAFVLQGGVDSLADYLSPKNAY